ncbi:1452_t:CDS:2 [Cetraspora pellucida]|uniref:1452_t:CDS:1 n=1 Tax=Cetraspora pellucida TaxID=1433469 RepID=A0A9N9BCD5_9GLOM|nr:1452_t:CDS:2 [Cetraspora pellucida]
MLYCVFAMDEVKPSKKYQGDKDALAWPFRIMMAGASNSDVTFSTLSSDKIPDFKKFNAKRSTLAIFEVLYSDSPAIQKKIIPFFTRVRHENISSIYVAQKFYKISINIHENATHIVLFNASKIIDGYLRQKEFIVIDLNKPRIKSFLLRWNTPLDLEKEIKGLKDKKHSA